MMSFESEIGRIAEEASSRKTLSEVVKEINPDTVVNSGTSISRDKIIELIKYLELATKHAEDKIRTGGRTWDERTQVESGFIPVVTEQGSRGFDTIIDELVTRCGYEGQLHKNMDSPRYAFPVTMRYNPEKNDTQFTVICPLPQIGVLSLHGERWDVGAYRTFSSGGNKFGVALIKAVTPSGQPQKS